MRPYQPRETVARGPVEHRGWALNAYTIVYGGGSFEPSRFIDGRPMALACLPAPAVTSERLGVGLLIEHQGANVDYLVLGWWDRENELPLRVFVNDPADGEGWRAARGGESVCVWDLEVVWREREAYVATAMGADQADARARYLTHGRAARDRIPSTSTATDESRDCSNPRR
jgi:hypothetical protein